MNDTGTIEPADRLVTAPMIVAGIGTLLSIVGMFMVKCREGATQKELLTGPARGHTGQLRPDHSGAAGHVDFVDDSRGASSAR